MRKILVLLFVIVTSCGQYDTLFDTPILPLGSKSILIEKSLDEVQEAFMLNGLAIMSTDKGYETSVFKLKNAGYVKYEFEKCDACTKIQVLYSDDDYKELQYLEYQNDSTMKTFNYLIELFYNDGIYYQK